MAKKIAITPCITRVALSAIGLAALASVLTGCAHSRARTVPVSPSPRIKKTIILHPGEQRVFVHAKRVTGYDVLCFRGPAGAGILIQRDLWRARRSISTTRKGNDAVRLTATAVAGNALEFKCERVR